MAGKKFDFSENSFLGSAMLVVGFLGTAATIVTFFTRDQQLILATIAGASTALSVCLLVLNGIHRRRIAALESEKEDLKVELSVERDRVDHFAHTANNVSKAVLTAFNMLPEAGPAIPRRRRPEIAPEDDGGA